MVGWWGGGVGGYTGISSVYPGLYTKAMPVTNVTMVKAYLIPKSGKDKFIFISLNINLSLANTAECVKKF